MEKTQYQLPVAIFVGNLRITVASHGIAGLPTITQDDLVTVLCHARDIAQGYNHNLCMEPLKPVGGA